MQKRTVNDSTESDGAALAAAADAPHAPVSRESARQARIHWLVAFASVALAGLIHTLARRWSMNPDGISYLDIADRYAGGDWAAAINGTWSPALSWLLAGVFRMVNVDARFEFTIVHLTIYALYLLAFFAFEWFLRTLVPQPRPWFWNVAAYGVFLWATLFLVDLQEVTPDIAVVAFTFGAAALALSIRRQPGRTLLWAALGAVLGAAYLTKAVMLHVGLVLVVTTVLAVGRTHLSPARILALAVAAIAVAGPWIGALSQSKGRLTTGDVGTISIAWFLNGVTPVQHWQGSPREFGTPLHPTRQLLADPHVYEFGTPIAATHPPRFDPSYWYEGVEPRVDVSRMTAIALANIGRFSWIMLPLGIALAGLVRSRGDAKRVLTHWPLFVPMLAGIGAFAALYFEPRYVGGFVAVLYLTMLAPFMKAATDAQGPAATAGIVPLLITCLLIAPVAYVTALRALQLTTLTGENPHWTMARAVDARGIAEGSRIAVIGNAQDAYWARLGRYRVVAEIPPPQSDVFWSCDEREREAVLDVLASTGAGAVVALNPPGWARISGWTPATEGGPLIATSFVPRERAIAADVPPSYMDYRIVNRCAPKQPEGRGS